MTGHATVEWSDLAIDGAFMLGAIAGAVAAIHLTRSIMEHVRRDDDRRDRRTPRE